jgi:hypothetical protein
VPIIMSIIKGAVWAAVGNPSPKYAAKPRNHQLRTEAVLQRKQCPLHRIGPAASQPVGSMRAARSPRADREDNDCHVLLQQKSLLVPHPRLHVVPRAWGAPRVSVRFAGWGAERIRVNTVCMELATSVKWL